MRAIWKGAVSFGLVNVPVRPYSATENHDVQFRQVHREDGGRIRYRRMCSVDGEEIGVTTFVPADRIDPMWLDKSYHLEPDRSATKP